MAELTRAENIIDRYLVDEVARLTAELEKARALVDALLEHFVICGPAKTLSRDEWRQRLRAIVDALDAQERKL